jgi:hypothetical protein
VLLVSFIVPPYWGGCLVLVGCVRLLAVAHRTVCRFNFHACMVRMLGLPAPAGIGRAAFLIGEALAQGP